MGGGGCGGGDVAGPCGVCRCSLRLAGGGTRVRGWVREGGCGCGAGGSVGEVSRPAPGVGAGLVVRLAVGRVGVGAPRGKAVRIGAFGGAIGGSRWVG